jgi:F420-non-reducing hydrogenase iron-sulfur subunit
MAEKKVRFLQRLLEFSGINPERLRMRMVSSAEASEYVHQISQFVEDIRKIGPNRLKTKEAA